MGRGARGEHKRKADGELATTGARDEDALAAPVQVDGGDGNNAQQPPPPDWQMEDDEDDAADACDEDDTIVHADRSTKNAISGGRHPRGVKPMGNLIMAGGVNIRTAGLGPLLGDTRAFTDESLLDLLKMYCEAPELVALSRTSKALYVFAGEEELWRNLTLERWGGDFRFVGDWKNTYALMSRREAWRNKRGNAEGQKGESAAAAAAAAAGASSADAATSLPPLGLDPSIPDFPLLPAPLQVSCFYSDYLFQSFYCSHIDLLSSYGEARAAPGGVAGTAAAPAATTATLGGRQRPIVNASSAPLDTIERVDARDLTPAQFRDRFGSPNRPCIIRGLMDAWPCYAPGPAQWNEENWERMYGDRVFKVGRYNMVLSEYFRYMRTVRSDESPLYLFDSKFGEKVPQLLREYEVPRYFDADLFSLLERPQSDEEKQAALQTNDDLGGGLGGRPSYRWILVGPARSGSTFHKDPNHTSAWNALISGRKKWIMYPPDSPPPGVFPSENQAEVCTPISVVEWFINYYDEHRGRIEAFEEQKRYEATRQQYMQEQQQKKQAAAGVADAPAPAATSDRTTRNSKRAKTAATPNGNAPAAAAAAAAAPAAATAAPVTYPAGPVECICEPGEVIFIPNGWWHTALNLTPSFAVTQNYVNEDNLWNVCDFLATDAMEVERNLALLRAFEGALADKQPELANLVQEKRIEKELAEAARAEAEAAASRGKKKSSLWERLTGPIDTPAA